MGKKKTLIITIVIIIIMVLSYGAVKYFSAPDGSTLESREELLKMEPKNVNWNISGEQEFNGYLLSRIYSETEVGIAVFEPKGKGKYEILTKGWRNKGNIVITGAILDGKWYDLIWFDGAETTRAEITYTFANGEKKPIDLDTSDGQIICSEAPDEDYSMEVVYLDDAGNEYW